MQQRKGNSPAGILFCAAFLRQDPKKLRPKIVAEKSFIVEKVGHQA